MQKFPENKREFTVCGKSVTVYPALKENCPVVYLNIFSDVSDAVYKLLYESGCNDFTLVTVGNLEWDCDMSPWAIPPVAKGDTPCSGGADEYLKLLETEIIPKAEENLKNVSRRGIAGYSLAGLFAVYALYKTGIFARAASMSGSLWFPKFREFVFENKLKKIPEKIYFSLGDKECKTKNPYFKTVQKNTEAIEEFYRRQGVETVFILNSGGHVDNVTERTAAGIRWILEK
ncbi:MAG: alpha/beta hydrolase-fold protein [Ruminococcus sp.]|nr:alpha/beta hydrolase-fold protein [Ruminococcus sp.]